MGSGACEKEVAPPSWHGSDTNSSFPCLLSFPLYVHHLGTAWGVYGLCVGRGRTESWRVKMRTGGTDWGGSGQEPRLCEFGQRLPERGALLGTGLTLDCLG